MKTKIQNTLLVAAMFATAAPLAFGSAAALAQTQTAEQRAEKQKAREKAKDAREDATEARQDARQKGAEAAQHQREATAAGNAADRQHHAAAAQAARDAQARANARATQREAAANQAARQENRADRQQAQIANQAARQDDRADRQAARRLNKAQQEQLISAQKARVNQYRSWTQSQRTAAQQAARAVQQQNRSAQYSYIQDYNNRLMQQQQRYSTTNFNYYNDPYFYSAPIYRYQRDGRYYNINQYGANMLQQAINSGYGEGYRSGRADRMDGWRADYRSAWVYQNASYGYNGYYGDRSEYSYYFRQGFRRGYEDGYYSRQQYGSYRNGNYSIIGAVLTTILGLQDYDYRY